MRRTRRPSPLGFVRHFALVIPVIVLGLAGCFRSGPTISTVSGKVTVNGQPVTEGVVAFASESGFAIECKLAADGAYALHSHHGKGIPLGPYKVTIAPPPFSFGSTL
ncbi:MAG: hypothetical protein K8R46_12440, partial [Pirellulales bacterium]|nr:hypothetical protein [Pirellulales bacterium]